MTEPPENVQQQPSPPPPPPQTADLPMAPPVPASAYGQPETRAVPAGMYLDQASGLALPEGVELASVGRRIGAYFLAIPLGIVTLGIGYLIWGVIVWARGQTPALQVLGMRCWRTDDNRIAGFWWMALREVVGRLLEGILSIISLLVSFILMCSRPDRRSIHDLIAGTVVLYDPNKVLADGTGRQLTGRERPAPQPRGRGGPGGALGPLVTLVASVQAVTFVYPGHSGQSPSGSGAGTSPETPTRR